MALADRMPSKGVPKSKRGERGGDTRGRGGTGISGGTSLGYSPGQGSAAERARSAAEAAAAAMAEEASGDDGSSVRTRDRPANRVGDRVGDGEVAARGVDRARGVRVAREAREPRGARDARGGSRDVRRARGTQYQSHLGPDPHALSTAAAAAATDSGSLHFVNPRPRALNASQERAVREAVFQALEIQTPPEGYVGGVGAYHA